MASLERTDVTRAESTSAALMWFGVLAGPIVWAAQLLIDFGLDETIVCAPGSRTRGVFSGVPIGTVIQITNAVATAVVATAFVVSLVRYRRLRAADATPGRRALWMASAGMFNSALFLLAVVLTFASPFFLSPCGRPL